MRPLVLPTAFFYSRHPDLALPYQALKIVQTSKINFPLNWALKYRWSLWQLDLEIVLKSATQRPLSVGTRGAEGGFLTLESLEMRQWRLISSMKCNLYQADIVSALFLNTCRQRSLLSHAE